MLDAISAVPVLPTIRITAPLEAELDSNITLKLEVTGEPEPKVTLHENDKPIEPIRISREGNSNVFNYVVKAPARGDQVNYSAVAQSPAGKANDAAEVKLVRKYDKEHIILFSSGCKKGP